MAPRGLLKTQVKTKKCGKNALLKETNDISIRLKKNHLRN